LITIRNGIEEIQKKPDATILSGINILDKKIIGTITTLIKQKGVTYLIDVAKRMSESRSDFVFLIVGDGHLRKELEQKVNTLGLSNYVIFTGWKENASSKVIPLIDIFFQPSLWEAMSMVILEAMSIGKPIVATNVGENCYVIKEGETGYLVEPKDIDAMCDALCRLLDNEKLRIKFGEAAKRRVTENYTAKSMAENHMTLYRNLIINK
jgi:glycosyltransferase involved in cell wall biosynthesis